MPSVSVSQLRADLSTTVNRVAFAGERVVLERQGKQLAALVSMEDLAHLEEYEDFLLARWAERLAEDPENQEARPWEELKAELGL